MTDEIVDEQDEKKKKKGGETEGAGQAKRSGIEASEAAMEVMRARGFTLQQIKDILSNWKHLDAKEVASRLLEFSGTVAKASAHIVVSFAKTTGEAGYAIVTHFLKSANREASLNRKLTAENKQRHTHDRHNDLG